MTTTAATPLPPARRAPPPWYLVVPVVLSALGVALPLGYLVWRAFDADATELASVLLRWRNLELLVNTVGLTFAVLAVTVAIAVPTAWLTTRTDLPFARVLSVATVLPLAVPGYLMAYTLLTLGGAYGASAQLTGVALPRLSGFWGALVALSLYNYPYMLLTVRAAMQRLDPGLEEVARSLGQPPRIVFWRVVLPHLRPALLAGALLVSLHVITDFGVVSLMNFHTLSYALYLQYELTDTVYASWIALVMLALAGTFIAAELWLLRGLVLHRAGTGPGRRPRLHRLGWWKAPALLGVGALLGAAVLLPTATIGFWATRAPLDGLAGELWASTRDSLSASLPAAVLATTLAVPVAYIAQRYPGKRAIMFERLSYAGYATPSLAFALGLVVTTLHLAPWLYQTLFVLIYALSLHFLAEAVGPVRASLYHATPRLEEAARALGRGRLVVFVRVTLPLIRSGLMVSLALVFLSAMKELPLTVLLSPPGFDPLSLRIWSYTEEIAYARAAPFALMILVVSLGFVAVLLWQGGGENVE
ncbi:MAG: ABC transporter permease [Phycisphaeraceae bacterium]